MLSTLAFARTTQCFQFVLYRHFSVLASAVISSLLLMSMAWRYAGHSLPIFADPGPLHYLPCCGVGRGAACIEPHVLPVPMLGNQESTRSSGRLSKLCCSSFGDQIMARRARKLNEIYSQVANSHYGQEGKGRGALGLIQNGPGRETRVSPPWREKSQDLCMQLLCRLARMAARVKLSARRTRS